MKHGLLSFLMVPAVVFAAACAKGSDDNNKPDPAPDDTAIPAPAFATGADIGWASEMEHDGKAFRLPAGGAAADLLDVLKGTGVNAIRLRVWVDPEGGWSGKEDVVAMARRVQAAGLPLMVDFHYSDFFADPGRQTVPAAWKADTGNLDKMCTHVTDHTTEVLEALKAAGVTPAWVQIGNETRSGMIWPTGQLSKFNDTEWSAFARLYKAGYAAAKAVCPNAIVMPHLNHAYEDNAWWFNKLKICGASFDAIALSHYPQSDNDKLSWQNLNSTAASRILALSQSFGVKVMVSEIGVRQSDPALGKQILADFLSQVSRQACAGVFYWEPEVYGWWKPAVYSRLGWNSYDMGAFSSDGSPSAILDPFKEN